MGIIKKDKPNCDLGDLRIYAKELDDKLNAKGKLNEYLLMNKSIKKDKACVTYSFDTLLAEIIKFCAINP